MFVRQSKNSFIRTTSHYGYVINQLSYHDRVYDETGAEFLKQITRDPKSIDKITADLSNTYINIDKETLKKDVIEFIDSLKEDGFVVTGDSIEELNNKDIDFTYDTEIPKTIQRDFTQATKEKINRNTQDFFLEKNQGRPLISNLQLELSSRCNERCIHCYIPNGKKNHGIDMPFLRFQRIIDEFAEMGGIHVGLSGGEALLHKDIIKMLYYCREKDLKISVLSNLINLTDEHVKALKDTNVSLVQVSLYSMDPEVHDFITTVRGSFHKTKKAIEKLVAANVPVQISCPLMKANKDGYKEVLKYAQTLKVRSNADYIMMAQADLDTTNLTNRLSLEETEQVLSDIIEYDLDYVQGMQMTRPIAEEMNRDKEKYLSQPLCGVGYDNCCITANGDVYPCAGWQDYIIGNVYSKSLKDLWENSQQLKELRKVNQASFPECIGCEARQYCSRCLVRNYNENKGDMFKINKHFCDVAFLNKRLVEEKYGKKIKELKELFTPETNDN